MEPKKITYTVSWTQSPGEWNIPGTIRLLEQARKQAADAAEQLIEKQLEDNNFSLAEQVLSKFKLK
jgi:hypothetical protein